MPPKPSITPDPADPFVMRAELFGVEYAIQDLATAGRLFLTPYGYPFRHLLHPDLWYTNKLYTKFGARMSIATGTVYRMTIPPLPYAAPPYGSPKPPPLQRSLTVIIKFCRVGQPVPVWIAPSAAGYVTDQDTFDARFVGPFEEFGLAEELRHAPAPNKPSGIRVKKPLAIYEPATHFELWQTGRIASDFEDSARRQRRQLPPGHPPELELHIDRDYILLYAWVNGCNAQEMLDAGGISEETFRTLVPRAVDDLESRNFRMLDIKPAHLILRQRRDGTLLTRNGQPAYVLVDYELVVHTHGQRHTPNP